MVSVTAHWFEDATIGIFVKGWPSMHLLGSPLECGGPNMFNIAWVVNAFKQVPRKVWLDRT